MLDDIKDHFQEYILSDTELSDASQGDIIVRIKPNEKELSENENLDQEEEISKLQGKNVEIIEVTKDYFDNFIFWSEVEIAPARNSTKSLEIAMFNQFLESEMTYFPELVNKANLHRDFLIMNDRDPERLINKELASVPNPMIGVGHSMAGGKGNLGDQQLMNQIINGTSRSRPSLAELTR